MLVKNQNHHVTVNYFQNFEITFSSFKFTQIRSLLQFRKNTFSNQKLLELPTTFQDW